jgi:hypothetical protein
MVCDLQYHKFAKALSLLSSGSSVTLRPYKVTGNSESKQMTVMIITFYVHSNVECHEWLVESSGKKRESCMICQEGH